MAERDQSLAERDQSIAERDRRIKELEEEKVSTFNVRNVCEWLVSENNVTYTVYLYVQ